MGTVHSLPPRIRVIEVSPSKRLPREIFRQIIGVTFPYQGTFIDWDDHPHGKEICGYRISEETILMILEKTRPAAFEWFRLNPHVFENRPYLFLSENSCKFIDPNSNNNKSR